MQLEDMSTAELIALVKRQEQELVRQQKIAANATKKWLHWEGNHRDVVKRLKLATERPDLPVDRIPAIKELERLQQELEARTDTVAIPLVEFKHSHSNSPEFDGIRTAAQPVQQPAPVWTGESVYTIYRNATEKPHKQDQWPDVREDHVRHFERMADALNALAAPVAAPVAGKEPVAFAIYGIGAGKHYLHAVKLASDADDGEWKTDSDCLGDYWAGNVPIYNIDDPRFGGNVPAASVQPDPESIQKAFVTLETCEGKYQIVMKFNQKEDAYATHDFLIQSGGREYNTRPQPDSGRDAALMALDPRRWTKEMSDAWHRAIPDVPAAFAALRAAANIAPAKTDKA